MVKMSKDRLKRKINLYCEAGEFEIAKVFAEKYSEVTGLDKTKLLEEIEKKQNPKPKVAEEVLEKPKKVIKPMEEK